MAMENSPLKNLDGWHWRDEFFELPHGDIHRLADFLNEVGVWPGSDENNLSAPGLGLRFPLKVDAADVWELQYDLKAALTNRKKFKEFLAPVLSRPKTWIDLYSAHPANNFQLRFELSDVAAGIVTITNARHMLIATALADVAQGIKFKNCKGKGCTVPFSITDKRQRKKTYHNDACQHRNLVRRRRKEKGRA